MNTFTLGELIGRLEMYNKDAQVIFDFCDMSPLSFDSWRGDYAQLALSWQENNNVKVADLIKMCKECDGKIYCGWKGGDFEMDLNSQVWIDECGHSSCTAITGVRMIHDSLIMIETGYREY